MNFPNSTIALLLVALLSTPAMTALAQPAVQAGSPAGASSTASPDGAAKAGSDTARNKRKMNHQLVRRVAAALARVRGLDSSRILIRAVDGTVTLSGTVPDNSQVPLAIDAAQRVEGVMAVRNQLRLALRIE